MPTAYEGAAWKPLPARRCCLTCRFYEPVATTPDAWRSLQASDRFWQPGTGYCRHPKRALPNGVVLLVRWLEVNCRNGWGNDLWESYSRN
jgi:hypothetical protein